MHRGIIKKCTACHSKCLTRGHMDSAARADQQQTARTDHCTLHACNTITARRPIKPQHSTSMLLVVPALCYSRRTLINGACDIRADAAQPTCVHVLHAAPSRKLTPLPLSLDACIFDCGGCRPSNGAGTPVHSLRNHAASKCLFSVKHNQ